MDIPKTSAPALGPAQAGPAAVGGARPESGESSAMPSRTSAPASAPPSAAELARALQQLQDDSGPHAKNLQFSVDQDLNAVIVKVVDGDTKEVIRQIPSEEAVRLARSMDKPLGKLIEQEV